VGITEVDRRVLVVDGANVVGSVPDGWWRDRAGAAARLHASLVTAGGRAAGDTAPSAQRPATDALDAVTAYDWPYDEIVLVLEGQARAGVGPGETYGVRTVHATASGDDEIVAQCAALTREGAAVTLASADRGLIARVRGLGVAVVGPRTVRSR